MEQKKKAKSQKTLISNDFFAEGIEVDESKIYPLLVIATMSSGKSTLINSLLGQQFLPSKNEACTAKMFSILDDDNINSTEVYITDLEGVTSVKKNNISEELVSANNNPNVKSILIKGHVKGVLNTEKTLMIIDTPGPNNARDSLHEKEMKAILGKVKGGLMLYVINATQFGINDDKNLLEIVKKQIKQHPKTSLLFAINKLDQIDEEKGESVGQLVMDVREYLVSNGIENPRIIPVSALAASLFKKVLSGETLTRSEYHSFCEYYAMYEPKDYSMKTYAITEAYSNQYDIVNVRGKEYSVGNLNRAIENTGIKLLEEEIQKAQILSDGIKKNTIKVKRR